jgi:hypothetical protein
VPENTQFVNLRTNGLIEAFNEGNGFVTVATVRPDGYGPHRVVKSDSFRTHYLDADGKPHKTGYVPVSKLPGDHPHARKTETGDMDLAEHIDELSDDELAELILRQQEAMATAKDIIDRAKAVVKSRNKELATRVYGNVAMVFISGRKFDAVTARRNLSAEEYRSICMPKPDATLAKKILGEESAAYARTQKDNGWTLTVREATDKDRDKAESEAVARQDVEVFDVPQF